MVNTALASLAIFGASAVASRVGRAQVINKCSYPVTLCNVPSSGGGYEQQEQSLASGESWEQTWTELSNGNGWSIKLSKTPELQGILQYEYTFHDDGIIWYDLSCVDGNPWDQDWEITADGSDCSPKQQAYRYSTDDAYGMQSCSQDADITVTLCTGISADNGTSSGGVSSAPVYSAATTTAPSYLTASAQSPPSYPTPSPSSSSSSTSTSTPPHAYNWNNGDASSSEAAAGYTPQVTPTTFATMTTAANQPDPYVVIVTEFATAYVTAEVTAEVYGRRERRHDHHVHAHHHQQHNA